MTPNHPVLKTNSENSGYSKFFARAPGPDKLRNCRGESNDSRKSRTVSLSSRTVSLSKRHVKIEPRTGGDTRSSGESAVNLADIDSLNGNGQWTGEVSSLRGAPGRDHNRVHFPAKRRTTLKDRLTRWGCKVRRMK
jgi:hypothetical protein